MRAANDSVLLEAIRSSARPLTGSSEDHDDLVDLVGDARFVLLGEATHGTHEFYAHRAQLTKRLVLEKGFSAVAVEADWPDAYRVNRYVRALGGDAGAAEALAAFRRFPAWMWRNADVLDFAGWLREHDDGLDPELKVGFYGLDLYSLHASMRAVVDYLERRDPAAARAARASYACFDQFGTESDTYAWATARLGEDTCEDAVTRQLLALHQRRAQLRHRDGTAAADEFFEAEQNARLARNAERYYRTMFRGRSASWNVRDEHMAETLDELRAHLQRRGQPPKVVVWAHNSHLGDARATEMGEMGELNLGQLARERHGTAVKSIGFTTYSGTVLAASDWGGEAEVKRVRPALPDSYEELFHELGAPRFFLPIDTNPLGRQFLPRRRLERAIGVIYRPDSERQSHYFHARLSQQFDAVIHFDQTQAVQPLAPAPPAPNSDLPETFPSGV